ncbi:MAG: DUF1178 family protein [Burkholderiales bacterium]|jgi:hypothetical protein|nr:DUF1178 family protein [Burkholderiales bacterium]
MIVFELICSEHHRFEGWFASGDDFDHQKTHGLLVCPVCGGGSVNKLPTANVQKGRESPQARALRPPVQKSGTEKRTTLAGFIDHVLLNSEDVGEAFPDEARKIHREEAPQRAIRGTASRSETSALIDEGIPVLPLPIPPRGDWH